MFILRLACSAVRKGWFPVGHVQLKVHAERSAAEESTRILSHATWLSDVQANGTRCRFNAGQASATLAQQQNGIGSMFPVSWDVTSERVWHLFGKGSFTMSNVWKGAIWWELVMNRPPCPQEGRIKDGENGIYNYISVVLCSKRYIML